MTEGRAFIRYLSYRTFDGKNWGLIEQMDIPLSPLVSAAVFQNALCLAFRGSADDDANHWCKLVGNHWYPPQNLAGGGSLLGPSLGVFGGRLFAIWQGVAGDDGIYWSSCSDGQNWNPQQKIPGVGTSGIPQLAALPDRLVAAWMGVLGDDGIYCSYLQGNGPWAQPQQKVAGVGSTGGPGLISLNNQVLAVWQGDPGDSSIWWSVVTPG